MWTMDHDTVSWFFAKSSGKTIPMEEDAGFGHRFETFAKFNGGQGKLAKSELTRRGDQTLAKIKGTLVGSDLGKRLTRHLLMEIKEKQIHPMGDEFTISERDLCTVVFHGLSFVPSSSNWTSRCKALCVSS